jgi:hypothetical protein
VDLTRGLQGKEPRRAKSYIPNQNRKGKAPNPPQENHQEKAPKITKTKKRERQQKALKNHVESSIHTKKDSYNV